MNRTITEKNDLYRKIQELSFVKAEIELFLDTHPDSRVAMDYYKETLAALDSYMTKYQAEYGPIHATAGIMADRWAWVDMPWPWQNGEKAEAREEKR